MTTTHRPLPSEPLPAGPIQTAPDDHKRRSSNSQAARHFDLMTLSRIDADA